MELRIVTCIKETETKNEHEWGEDPSSLTAWKDVEKTRQQRIRGAFQYPSPYYLGATVRLGSSAVTFSTWSVQRSLAEPSIVEKIGGEYGSDPQKERKRKRRR